VSFQIVGGLQVLGLLILGSFRVGNETWFVTMFARAAMAVLHVKLQVVLSALASVSCLVVLLESREAGLPVLTRPDWLNDPARVIGSLLWLHGSATPVVPPILAANVSCPARLDRIFQLLFTTTPQGLGSDRTISCFTAKTSLRIPHGSSATFVQSTSEQQAGGQNA
jgi:hypothetical protein